MATDSVMVIVDWSQAESSGDATAYLEEKAIHEMELGKGYNDTEIGEVQRDPTFKESVRDAAKKLHHAETRRQNRVLHGKEGTPDRVVEKVRITYTRPLSRGMWNREVDAMRE